MFSILTTNGQSIVDQSDSSGDKITITGFKVGMFTPAQAADLRDEDQDYDFSSHPNLKDATFIEANFTARYTGDADDITYTLVDPDSLVLSCFLPQDAPFFDFNAVLVYATIDGVESLFTFHYALTDNPKFSTLINRYGLKHYFLLVLKVATRDDRFDFANLTLVAPEFDSVESLFDLPYGSRKEHDQFILQVHEQSDHVGPHVVFNSQDDYWGAPLIEVPMDEERPVVLPIQGNYYPHDPDDAVPTGFDLAVDGDSNPILDRFGNQMITREPE